MQGIHLRKYGVEAKIPFCLYEVDGVDLRVDAADGGTDCALTKDEGAETTCDNDFVDEGSGYSITLTATEMEAARISVYIIDSATKVWLDEVLVIETYGNASAQHAFDLDTASVAQGADNNTILSSINIANGSVESDLTYIHGTALTETAGQLAAAFKKLFDVATPLLVASDVMVGTDGANTTVPDAAGVAPTAVEIRTEMDNNSTELAKIGTIPALDGGAQTIGAAIAKIADDNGGADFDAGTDSLQELRDRGDAAWTTGAGGDATEANQNIMIAKLLAYFRLALRSDAAVETDASTELTAINADEGAGAGDFSSQAESQEAIKDYVAPASEYDTEMARITGNVALASNYTAARAGYLDNLNISENVAGVGDVTIVKNTIDSELDCPDVLESPEAGNNDFRIELSLVGTNNAMQAPDSLPTITVYNQGGTARTLNLLGDGTDMTNISTGRYYSIYRVDTSHALEQLTFVATVVEGGQTRYPECHTMVRDDNKTKIDAMHTALITSNSELAGVPAANAALVEDIKFLAMALRNKYTSTAAQADIHNDAGASIASAALSDDATKLIIGKFA